MRRGATVRYAAILMAGASLAACATVRPEYATQAPAAHRRGKPPSAPGLKGTEKPYQVGGIWYVPKAQPHYNETGVASWYGDAFHLKPTADGEIFDKDVASAAHTTLPLPSLVEVTNLDNGRKLIVRVNDRGPFVDNRIIDLSHEAARQLGYDRQGLARVRVRYIGPAPALANEDSRRYAYLAPKTPAAAAAPPPPPRKDPQAEFTAQPLSKPPAIIVQAALAPLPTAAPAAARAPLIGDELPALKATRYAAGPPAAAPAGAGGFRIQVGAFSTPENAERAVAQLASTGAARIEPLTTRSGATLYRVVLEGGEEEGAEALREKVAESGFADARVIGR
jgi:rare lipoprotein A